MFGSFCFWTGRKKILPNNQLFPVRQPPLVGGFQAELAAAVLLLVELVLADDFDAALAQAAFALVSVFQRFL